MSGDADPVIHTVGSVDGPDQVNVRDKIHGYTDSIPPRVPGSKLDKAGDAKREQRGDSVTAPGTQHHATSPHTSSESGVVGEIRTVGSAATNADAGASSGLDTENNH